MFLIVNFFVVDFFMGIVSLFRVVELLYNYNGILDVFVFNIVGYFIGVVLIFVVVLMLMVMFYDWYVVIIKFF